MAKYIYDTEEKVGLSITTIQEELAFLPEDVKQTVKQRLCTSGGIFVAVVTVEMIQNMKNIMTDSDVAASMDQVVPGPNITVLTDFVEGLSNEELKAALMHEIGHIKDGILDRLDQCAAEQTVGCFVIDLKAEMAADEYAAKMVNKEAMRSAIVKLIHNTVKVVYKFASPEAKKPDHNEVVSQMLADPIIAARLAALS